jgi:hypothetical protein
LGQFDLGEALSKMENGLGAMSGIFLVERCAEVALKIQRSGIYSSLKWPNLFLSKRAP